MFDDDDPRSQPQQQLTAEQIIALIPPLRKFRVTLRSPASAIVFTEEEVAAHAWMIDSSSNLVFTLTRPAPVQHPAVNPVAMPYILGYHSSVWVKVEEIEANIIPGTVERAYAHYVKRSELDGPDLQAGRRICRRDL